MKAARIHVLPLLLMAGLCLCLAVKPATAQTLTGHHDGTTPFGYTAFSTSVIVPADTGGSPSATFDNHSGSGLYLLTAVATVKGGQFNNNKQDGIIFTDSQYGPSSGTISGGVFSGNFLGVDLQNSAVVTITGGTFSSNIDYGIGCFTGSAVTVSGGVFSGNILYDFAASFGSTCDIFGSFLDPATGIPLLPGQTRALTGKGSFQGTLARNLVPQSYTYSSSATMTLHDVATAPEPSPLAVLGVGLLGLCGRTLNARRRSA